MAPSTILARLASLGLSWAFAVVAASIGLNALIKSNTAKNRLKLLAPYPTRVEIHTGDIFAAGLCTTIASLLIAILTFVFFWLTIYPAVPVHVSPRVQAASLLFTSLFLLGSLIPYTILFLHGKATVRAFIGNAQLPDTIVKNFQNASGADGLYKNFHFLKLQAILPWFTLFFTLVAIGVLFVAHPASKTAQIPSYDGIASPAVEKEKESNP